MESVSKTLKNFQNLMDKNIRGVQITCYSVALIGLTVALRKVRPFSKFRKPSDIPNHFIKERRQLEGTVTSINPNGAFLVVEHKPLVPLPFSSSGELPVKISGINISGLGTNWLQSIVVGQKVMFLPLAKQQDFVQCQVLLVQANRDSKQQLINVGENLVKIGFAVPETIEKPLSEDSTFLRYYSLLLSAEKYALRKQLGIKYYIIPTKKLLNALREYLITLFYLSKQAAPKVIQRVPKIISS